MDSYLKRYDGFWIDPDDPIAYPYRGVQSKKSQSIGKSDYLSDYHDWKSSFGKDSTDVFMIEGRDINPYALGHIINHPPPGVPANCMFIDLDLPFTFFTSEYSRYLPYIQQDIVNSQKYEESGFHTNIYRGVVILTKASIASGQELFVDYLEDERVPFYTQPDWLIAPPPDPKYLTKEHYFHELGSLEKYLERKELGERGDLGIQFIQRTSRLENEEPKPIIESKKKFQALIEQKQKEGKVARVQEKKEVKEEEGK